jgi:nickel/cobalt transporter (NicO) family protein
VRRFLVVTAMSLMAIVVLAPGAGAHPLGNFTVNRYGGIEVDPGRVRVRYVLDMAEIPTFQELPTIDRDGDGVVSTTELDGWTATEVPTIADGLALTVNGRRIALRPLAGATSVLLPGQGGLGTLRLEAAFEGSVPSRGQLAYEDRNIDDRIGWHEVTVTTGEGAGLSAASVPATSVSDELRAYPQDMLSSPLDVRAMSATYAPGAGAGGASAAAPASPRVARPATEAAPLAGVLANRGIGLMVLGLLAAFGFGAWHALLPGHGKTLMAAAMVGAGARLRQATVVAVAVALMHTASVLALGLAVLGLERTFRPEALYPWLGLTSGLAAVGVGIYLVRIRWSAWRQRSNHHDHHDHHEHHEHGHVHRDPVVVTALTRRGLLALALAGGILPAPSALLALLASIQAHRVGYGLVLVLAFSAGLAGALLGVGAGALRARDAMARRVSGSVALGLPLASATAILVAGGVLMARAAMQV